MARCPDCGGEVKYKAPFMVCLDCGLSMKRWDFDDTSRKIKEEFRSEIGESNEETERKERQKKRAYHDWIMKKEE